MLHVIEYADNIGKCGMMMMIDDHDDHDKNDRVAGDNHYPLRSHDDTSLAWIGWSHHYATFQQPQQQQQQ
jgi:hypothetical protein